MTASACGLTGCNVLTTGRRMPRPPIRAATSILWQASAIRSPSNITRPRARRRSGCAGSRRAIAASSSSRPASCSRIDRRTIALRRARASGPVFTGSAASGRLLFRSPTFVGRYAQPLDSGVPRRGPLPPAAASRPNGVQARASSGGLDWSTRTRRAHARAWPRGALAGRRNPDHSGIPPIHPGCTARHGNASPDCPKRAECPIGESCPSRSKSTVRIRGPNRGRRSRGWTPNTSRVGLRALTALGHN